MGFARLAEDGIRKVRGKGESEKLGAMDKILASSIGGALATWNQPIEVVRVEVREFIGVLSGTRKPDTSVADAKYGKGDRKFQTTCEAHHRQHAEIYLPGKWHQRIISRCDSSYWSWNLANNMHGVIR